MRKATKKIVVLFMILGLVFTTACGFHVGTSSASDGYNQLFPDAAAMQNGAYKNSNIGYKYSIPNYGEMMVYVDTSEGHKFVLDEGDTGGFSIQDKNGEKVLQVYAVLPDVYRMVTAQIDETRTINGRDFFIHKDPNYVPIQVCSYMADCGMDLGFVMEAYGSEEPFRLVAFRGQPLEGSSSDLYFYKGTEADVTQE